MLSSSTQPLEAFQAEVNTPAREAARAAAQTQLEEIRNQIAASNLDGDEPDARISDADETSLISKVITILSTIAAIQEMAAVVAADQNMSLEQRWQYVIAMHQAEMSTFKDNNTENDENYDYDEDEDNNAGVLVENPETMLEYMPDDNTLTWLRLKEQATAAMEHRRLYTGIYPGLYQSLCADSGVQHPSPYSSNYPHQVHFLIEHCRENIQWEMGSWHFELSELEFSLVDLIRFDYNGERYIKTIQEPYPAGYPAELVKAQMMDILEDLSEALGAKTPQYEPQFTNAHGMYQAACHDLHSVSQHDIDALRDEIMTKLHDSDVTSHLIRSATHHERELGMLLNPSDIYTTPIATITQVNAIIKAGRAAGMSDVNLWEMAMLIGAEPENHRLTAPTISSDTSEFLQNVAEKYGLPTITIDRWSKTIDVS